MSLQTSTRHDIQTMNKIMSKCVTPIKYRTSHNTNIFINLVNES